MKIWQPIITEHREKILSYIEEGCLTFGILTGGTVALHIAASNLSYAVSNTQAVNSILSGAHIGSMIGVTAVYSIPIIAKAMLPENIEDELQIKDLFVTHNHKPARLAGLASGVALSLALTWGSVASMSGKPINIEPVMQASQDFFKAITESRNTQVADMNGIETIQLYPPGSVPYTVSYRGPAIASLTHKQAENVLSP